MDIFYLFYFNNQIVITTWETTHIIMYINVWFSFTFQVRYYVGVCSRYNVIVNLNEKVPILCVGRYVYYG